MSSAPFKLGESGFIQRLRSSLSRAGLDAHPRILVGFSGGADSLALLLGLKALADLDLLDLVAIHVDHGVREESATESEQVMALLARLGVEGTCHRLDAGAVSRHRGVGLEEALRRERYAAFAAAIPAAGAVVIALAHHQRDQAETVLLHLLRGAGLKGLSGMRPTSTLVVPWWTDEPGRSITLWRPLLDEPPAEILAVVAQSGLPVIADATNDERRFRRNAVRHDLLPMMEAIVPGATANVSRFADRAAEDESALAAIATRTLDDLRSGDAIEARGFRALPVALQRRMIQQWIRRAVPSIELSANRIDAVRAAFASGKGGTVVEVGQGWSVVIRGGRGRIVDPEQGSDAVSPASESETME